MKKITLTLALCGLAALLSSCGGSYRKVQSMEEQMSPYTCAGLHVKHAQWHFVDDFGQQVDVMGSCAKGMKHGTFEFAVGGQLVAKTKYIKDNESYTTCLVMGKTRTNLNECMKLRAANAPAQSAPMPNVNAQQF